MTADVTPVTAAAQAYGDARAADQAVADKAAYDALQTKYDAYVKAHPDVNPPPPPPPPTGTTLLGGLVDSTPGRMPKPKITRVYNQADALRAAKYSIPAVSYTPQLGGPGWSKNSALVATLKADLAALPDMVGVRVDHTHEFDNPAKYGTNVSAYLADSAVFASTVRAVSKTRKNALIIYRCCMAFSISQASRNILAFYSSDKANYDEVGCDVYSLSQINESIKFAAGLGKPLCVPEMGPLNAVAHTDAAILSYMQTGVPAFKKDNATWVAWFDKNGSGGDLSQYPNSLKYWNSQI